MALGRLASSLNTMDVTDWVAVGSMLAAFAAAWQAWRSTRLAAQMHAIAVDQQLRTETPLEVYLAESRLLHFPSEKRRVYFFDLLITNKSPAATSIKTLTLSLNYAEGDGPRPNVAIEHDSTAMAESAAEAPTPISIPRPVAAGETISGAALFPITDGLLAKKPVESYDLKVVDAFDRTAECHAVLLRQTDL